MIRGPEAKQKHKEYSSCSSKADYYTAPALVSLSFLENHSIFSCTIVSLSVLSDAFLDCLMSLYCPPHSHIIKELS
jgi:hypothetical protein